LSLDELDNNHNHDDGDRELSFEAQEARQRAHEKKTYFAHLNEDAEAAALAMELEMDGSTVKKPPVATAELVAAGTIPVDTNGLPIL